MEDYIVLEEKVNLQSILFSLSEIQINIIPKTELEKILPIVLLLNEEEDESTIKERVNQLKLYDHYFCIGVYKDEEIIGCCGIWKLHKIYAGKHLEVDNVAISPGHRGLSIGKKMIDWVLEYGRDHQYKSVELNAYMSNQRGVKFWENSGFVKKGYHMIHFF
jgi:ribosomal protein S18 acetylase RimI-like enzyme